MFAVVFSQYGDSDVLTVGDVLEPHAGPEQVRIRVVAASVNPFDWRLRTGWLKEVVPLAFPAIPGIDAAGVVDEVGSAVLGVAVGDEVFGLGAATTAEFAVLDGWAHKPADMSWAQAAGAGLVSETASRALTDLGVRDGSVLLVEGASGGVGSAAVQIARRRGATVVGTASAGNHDYLRELGAVPTTYGPGIRERVAALGVGQVTAVLDAAGSGSVAELVTLVDDPQQVVSVADYSAPMHGARVVSDAPRDFGALPQVAEAFKEGRHRIEVARVVPLDHAAEAHRLSETGHVRGKVVIAVRPEAMG